MYLLDYNLPGNGFRSLNGPKARTGIREGFDLLTFVLSGLRLADQREELLCLDHREDLSKEELRSGFSVIVVEVE